MSNPERYGEHFAERYDYMYGPPPEAAILRLAEWAGPGGRALELGIGTGRVALPLQAQGVAVHGIYVSPKMVAKLRAKPSGDRIQVTMGDFSNLDLHSAHRGHDISSITGRPCTGTAGAVGTQRDAQKAEHLLLQIR